MLRGHHLSEGLAKHKNCAPESAFSFTRSVVHIWHTANNHCQDDVSVRCNVTAAQHAATVSGPCGRRVRWHIIRSRFNLAVDCLPGESNVVADVVGFTQVRAWAPEPKLQTSSRVPECASVDWRLL